MTAPGIYLFQLQHPKEAPSLLGLAQRPLEGTVWLAYWAQQWLVDWSCRVMAGIEKQRPLPPKAGVLGGVCEIPETRGNQVLLAISARPKQPSSEGC